MITISPSYFQQHYLVQTLCVGCWTVFVAAVPKRCLVTHCPVCHLQYNLLTGVN